ncbi:transporter substrate-binding domain-containing protein [Pseudodesulfovibrio cashew]|uniref:Transporter substrate-binding domain-containing protein n=1 Tax=Pseudodesulfovibrio cashew TaxID=2678688 RepID=A0A6I6JGE9_9BACT|nr:transporter substrate-binding domain-containing protein [Pseudodesulfovibrio cashew]QGY39462.1 transporter substrate-binding domain-containing protein [Pseudodesulfovibrio cashew]
MRTVIVFAAVFFLCASQALAGEVHVIGMHCQVRAECKAIELENLLEDAYGRIGVAVEFVYLPGLRDLDKTNHGELDGSGLRNPIVVEKYPNIIKVPVPLFTTSLVAVTIKGNKKIHDLEDLNGLLTGVLRGDLIAISIASGSNAHLHRIDYLTTGLKMLIEGRLDVLFAAKTMLLINMEQFPDTNFVVSKDLYEIQVYHVVNKKHAHLVPLLERSFREMIAEGLMEKYLGRAKPRLPKEP